MDIDPDRVGGWLGALARRPDAIADVFVEERRWVTVDWKDGTATHARVSREGSLAVRYREAATEHLACVSATDETAAREAIRRLQLEIGREPLPVKPRREPQPAAEEPLPTDAERWSRRLAAVLARVAPRHRLRWTIVDATRRVVAVREPPTECRRRLVSLEGSFVAASRPGDETRAFSFHAPDADTTAEELRVALARAAEPRDAAAPCGEGETDLVLAGGCAAVLFHEILSHPLEAGAESPLAALEQARVAIPELDVRDDPTRLDLFGGYEWDDEGVAPRPVKLLDSGRLAGRLTDRAHASGVTSNGHGRRASAWDAPLVRGSNILVAGGQTTADDMTRRLHTGLWITDLNRGSIELASGRFRLRFPRARRVRRGRLADECGPGLIAGDILAALKSVEAGLGREVRTYRGLGWCARDGQVVPVGGAAPDILLRRLSVHSLS
jgi:predicted Zn-dependent protease